MKMKITSLIVKHAESGDRLISIQAKIKENQLKSKRNRGHNDTLTPFYDAINKKFSSNLTQEWTKYADEPLEVEGYNYKVTFWGKK